MDRSRRALLALLLALPAAFGVGLLFIGLAQLVRGRLLIGLCFLAAGAVGVAAAFAGLRRVNGQAGEPRQR